MAAWLGCRWCCRSVIGQSAARHTRKAREQAFRNGEGVQGSSACNTKRSASGTQVIVFHERIDDRGVALRPPMHLHSLLSCDAARRAHTMQLSILMMHCCTDDVSRAPVTVAPSAGSGGSGDGTTQIHADAACRL